MKISSDVMKVLEGLSFDGSSAVINGGQLDRKLYVEVNKVLEACGGKWNRKAKAHVFPDDAESVVSAAINSGEVRTAREDAFFPTPPDLSRALCALAGVRPRSTVLEPSAGDGAIVDALLETGAVTIYACERDAKRRSQLFARYDHETACGRVHILPEDDTMDVTIKVDHVVANVPFLKKSGRGGYLDHVQHCYGLLHGGGSLVSVLPAGVLFRSDQAHKNFRRWVETLDGRFENLPDDSFVASGTRVRTCVVILERR